MKAGFSTFTVGGVFNLSAPTPVDGQFIPLQLDSAGNLLVNVAVGGGGGTQYADGTTQATPTGTVALGKNPSNILHSLSLDASGNLNVNLAAGTISGGNAAASPTGSPVPASADYVGFNSGGNLVGVSSANPLPVAQQGTITVSGTVTSNQGGAPWSVTLPAGQAVELLDSGGTNKASISAAGALKVDGSAVTQPISGTVTANQGGAPWSVTLPAGQAVELLDSGGTNKASISAAGAVKVDGSAVTQPVSIAATVNVSVQNASLAVMQSTSPWVENVSQFGGNPVVTGTGLSGAGIPRVTVSSDSFPATQAVTQSTSPWIVSDSTLAPNAAQETGGNLAQTRDLIMLMISRLDAINLTLGSMSGTYIDPADMPPAI